MACNGLTFFTMFSTSDAFAQYMELKHRESIHLASQEKEPSRFSPLRVLTAGSIGAAFGAYVYPTAYALLDSRWKGKTFSVVLQKSIVEIATVGVFVNSVSMASRGLLVGRKPGKIAKHVRTELPRVTWNDARVWIPYNMLAFSVISPALRPTTTAIMESAWQSYISIRSHDYRDEVRKE